MSNLVRDFRKDMAENPQLYECTEGHQYLDDNGKDTLHPMYGKTQSDYQKARARKAALGNTWKKGKKVADTSKMKKPDAHKGAGNPRWLGGISLGEKRKEYMSNWYEKNKAHYKDGGKYTSAYREAR